MNTNITVSIIMAGCCIIALGLTLGLARKNIKNYYKKNKNMIFLPVLCGLFGVAAIVCGVWCLVGGGGKWCNLSSNSSPSGTTPIPPSGTTPIPPSGDDPEPDVGPVDTCYYSTDGIKYNSEDTLTDFVTASSDSWSRCSASANGCAATLNFDDTPPDGTTFVHQCNMQSLGSKEMVLAAEQFIKSNNLKDDYVFGIVGHDWDDVVDGDPTDYNGPDPYCGGKTLCMTTCCNTYEIAFPPYFLQGATAEPTKDYRSIYWGGKNVVTQAFNTAAGGAKNFDIYMPGGGFGAFNGCYNSPPLPSDVEEISNPRTSPYENSTMFSKYPMFGQPGEGGLRGGTKPGPDVLENGEPAAVDKDTAEARCQIFRDPDGNQDCDWFNACMWVWENNYHFNGMGILVRRVQTPKELQYVTGCSKNNTKAVDLAANSETSNPWEVDENNMTFKMKDGYEDYGWRGCGVGPTTFAGEYNSSLTYPASKCSNDTDSSIPNNGGHYTTTTMQDCCQGTCIREAVEAAGYGNEDAGEVFDNEDNKVFYGCTGNDDIIGTPNAYPEPVDCDYFCTADQGFGVFYSGYCFPEGTDGNITCDKPYDYCSNDSIKQASIGCVPETDASVDFRSAPVDAKWSDIVPGTTSTYEDAIKNNPKVICSNSYPPPYTG